MDFSFSFSRRKALYIFCLGLLITAVYILSTVRGAFLTFDLASVNAMPFLWRPWDFTGEDTPRLWQGYMPGYSCPFPPLLPRGLRRLSWGCSGPFAAFCRKLHAQMLPSVLACGSGLLALRGVISATYIGFFTRCRFFTVLASYLRIIAVSPCSRGFVLFCGGVAGAQALRRRLLMSKKQILIRTTALSVAMALIASVLCLRLVYLQLAKGDEYRETAARQTSVRYTIPASPRRDTRTGTDSVWYRMN